MKAIKNIIGITLFAVWAAIFLVMPSWAQDANLNNSSDSKVQVNTDAKGRGVATFSMNFSASANTEGNFDAEGSGMMQNMFNGNNREYYYKNK